MKTILIIVFVVTTLISGQKIVKKKVKRMPIPTHETSNSNKKGL